MQFTAGVLFALAGLALAAPNGLDPRWQTTTQEYPTQPQGGSWPTPSQPGWGGPWPTPSQPGWGWPWPTPSQPGWGWPTPSQPGWGWPTPSQPGWGPGGPTQCPPPPQCSTDTVTDTQTVTWTETVTTTEAGQCYPVTTTVTAPCSKKSKGSGGGYPTGYEA